MKKAKLEIYYGPMFSGKSALMIKEIISNIDKSKLIFKPIKDTRSEKVWTREGMEVAAIGINDATEILDYIEDWIEIIYIDELHFFDDNLYDVIVKILDYGINVVVAGLDTDFRAEPFSVAVKLIKLADKAIKLQARCHICGERSAWTARFYDGEPDTRDSETIISDMAEEKIEYKTVCRKHHPFLNKEN